MSGGWLGQTMGNTYHSVLKYKTMTTDTGHHLQTMVDGGHLHFLDSHGCRAIWVVVSVGHCLWL